MGKQNNSKAVAKVETAKPHVMDDNFTGDSEINDTPDNWESGDVGEFEVVNLKEEGDTWIGHLIKDCEADGLPDWLPNPDKWEDKVYETLNQNGQKGIISKYYRVVQYAEKYGMGKAILYKITRGKKAGNGQSDFVNFDVKFQKQK